MTREIQLTQNKVTLVDDSDFEYLNRYKWYFKEGYAARSAWISAKKCQQTVWMHHIIIKVLPGLEIDHINGNGCDNRRSNLRLCTHKQNSRSCEKHTRNASSKYKGVCWYKKQRKWRAYIQTAREFIHLGYFDVENDAAHAYNVAALNYFGEFAKPNVIEEAI